LLFSIGIDYSYKGCLKGTVTNFDHVWTRAK